MNQHDNIVCRTSSNDEMDVLYGLEIEAFPPDEAASKDTIAFRLSNAGQYCMTGRLLSDNSIFGFINGTCAVNRQLKHDTMTSHDPNGRYLCIHSVVIGEKFRRQGYGTALLTQYVEKLKASGLVDGILLLSKSNNLGFYNRVGFRTVGPSPVVHGQETWYECELLF